MALSPHRPPQKWHRVFNGVMMEIPSAASWLESIAADLGLMGSRAYAMQVCLEEVMATIVRHGRVQSFSKSYWPEFDPANPLYI
jgi:hypothetical protein